MNTFYPTKIPLKQGIINQFNERGLTKKIKQEIDSKAHEILKKYIHQLINPTN